MDDSSLTPSHHTVNSHHDSEIHIAHWSDFEAVRVARGWVRVFELAEQLRREREGRPVAEIVP